MFERVFERGQAVQVQPQTPRNAEELQKTVFERGRETGCEVVQVEAQISHCPPCPTRGAK